MYAIVTPGEHPHWRPQGRDRLIQLGRAAVEQAREAAALRLWLAVESAIRKSPGDQFMSKTPQAGEIR